MGGTTRGSTFPPVGHISFLLMALLGACPSLLGSEQATTQPAAGPATAIDGQVFDHMGAGVEGVTVTAQRPGVEGAGPRELANATTDETGDFQLLLPGRAAGKVVVTLAKPGFAIVTREVQLDPDDEFPPFVDVQLGGAGTLVGTVRDFRTEDSIAQAQVQLAFGYDKREVRSDADGRFEIDRLPPGPARLSVDASGYGRERLEITAVEQSEPLEVLLKPERLVHLRTVDGVGKPVGGVVVECLDEDRRDYRSAATDAAGKLTIRNVHYDTRALALRVAHESYVSSKDFDRRIDLPINEVESTHTLVLRAAGSIGGRVIERASGEPVNGARATAGDYAFGRCPRDFTGFDGTYRINGVEPGRRAVTVYARGYATELAQVEVAAGQVANLEIKLDPTTRVGGTVLDPDGKPLAGVHVMSVKWRGRETLTIQTLTDANGVFVLTDAPTDEFLITLQRRAYEPLLEQAVQAPKTDYSFKMAPGRGIGGLPGATLKVGDRAPPFELTALDGQTLKLADFAGKTVFLDFWATWCGPCVAETANVKKVHDGLGERDDFVMIGISLDTDRRALQRFLKDRKVTWPQVFGEKAGAERASRDYGAYAIPATFLIGPDGKIKALDLRGPGMKEQIAAHLGPSESK